MAFRDRYEIEELLREFPDDYMRAVNSSASTVYSLALERDLIKQDEYVAARSRYGDRWNYAGD